MFSYLVVLSEECYKFVHDDAKLGRFFEEDAKLVLRKQELVEKRDRLSKANAAMANIQVSVLRGVWICVEHPLHIFSQQQQQSWYEKKMQWRF